MLFLIGLACGVLAYKVGKWRMLCVFWEASAFPWNVPLAWRNTSFQLASWFLVALLSVGFATCWSILVVEYAGRVLGVFSWAMLLTIRWHASGIAAVSEGEKRLMTMEAARGTMREAENGNSP